jgi:hypothetical protein
VRTVLRARVRSEDERSTQYRRRHRGPNPSALTACHHS